MKKSDTVFLTTIYPASEQYLDAFFNSLENQTSKDFDVLVINDGISNFDNYRQDFNSLNFIEIVSRNSPAKNRESGIRKALELGYNYIVFGDSDDYFSANRLEESRAYLEEDEILINDLCPFNKEKISESILAGAIRDSKELNSGISKGNIFGFSNIAIQSRIIDPQIEFKDDLIVVDWFFISTLLIKKPRQIRFLNDVKTYYRQHDKNLIGMSTYLTEQKLDLGLHIKQNHYSAMIDFCKLKDLESQLLTYKHKIEQIKTLAEALTEPVFRAKYIQVVNDNIKDIFWGWWSEIITLEEFDFYENKNK